MSQGADGAPAFGAPTTGAAAAFGLDVTRAPAGTAAVPGPFVGAPMPGADGLPAVPTVRKTLSESPCVPSANGAVAVARICAEPARSARTVPV